MYMHTAFTTAGQAGTHVVINNCAGTESTVGKCAIAFRQGECGAVGMVCARKLAMTHLCLAKFSVFLQRCVMRLSATAPPAIPHSPLAIAPHYSLTSHTPQVSHTMTTTHSHTQKCCSSDTQCHNGGSCSATGQCLCPPGWSGLRCEQGEPTVA